MRTTAFVVVAVLTIWIGAADPSGQARDGRAEVALQAAIKLETVDGNLVAAIAAYKRVAETFASNRPVAAQALARLGQCFEKQGGVQAEQARKTYQQILASYSDQPDAVSHAKARLSALGVGSAPDSARRLFIIDATFRAWLLGTSADGRFAYLGERPAESGKSSALVIRDLASGTERTLPSVTVRQGEALLREISPDGRQIAHVTSAGDPRKCTIAVSGLSAGTSRVLTSLDWTDCSSLEWSDDGRRMLIWGEAKPDQYDFVLISATDGRVLWRYGKDGLKAQWSYVPVSPDGRFVALTETTAPNTISVFDAQSGAVSQSAVALSPGSPLWTADGHALLFVAGAQGERSLWRASVSAAGQIQGVKQIKTDVGSMRLFRANADGSLLYTRQPSAPGPDWHMAELNANVTTAESVTTLPGIHQICGFSWSPDGGSMVYGARLLKDYGGETVPCTLLAIRSVADGKERVLSPGFSEIRRPKWSPDGKRIAVYGVKGGVAGAYIIDAATGSAELITTATQIQTTGEDILTADWSSDGKGVYLGRLENGPPRTYRLVYRDLQSGAETERYKVTGPDRIFFTSTSVSNDGRVLLLTNEGSDRTAVVIPAGGGTAQTVFRSPIASRFSWTSWAADGRSIFVDLPSATTAEPTLRKLMRVPLGVGGTPIDLGVAKPGLGNHYPSPDGRRIYFGTFKPGAGASVEVWLMEQVGASGLEKGRGK